VEGASPVPFSAKPAWDCARFLVSTLPGAATWTRGAPDVWSISRARWTSNERHARRDRADQLNSCERNQLSALEFGCGGVLEFRPRSGRGSARDGKLTQ
jgi:hypothetical protein